MSTFFYRSSSDYSINCICPIVCWPAAQTLAQKIDDSWKYTNKSKHQWNAGNGYNSSLLLLLPAWRERIKRWRYSKTNKLDLYVFNARLLWVVEKASMASSMWFLRYLGDYLVVKRAHHQDSLIYWSLDMTHYFFTITEWSLIAARQ